MYLKSYSIKKKEKDLKKIYALFIDFVAKTSTKQNTRSAFYNAFIQSELDDT